MVGGFLGAVILTNISLASAKAWMSGLLIFFGLVIFGSWLVTATPVSDATRKDVVKADVKVVS